MKLDEAITFFERKSTLNSDIVVDEYLGKDILKWLKELQAMKKNNINYCDGIKEMDRQW